MNRPPIGQQEGTTKKGEGLAQLAAIADVVSRRSVNVPVPPPGSDRIENAADPPMRKRSIDSEEENSEPLKKRVREEETDTVANGKVIQFRQVSCL